MLEYELKCYFSSSDGLIRRKYYPYLRSYIERLCDLFQKKLGDHICVIELAYNNNFSYNIQIAPFEAHYGIKYVSPIGLFEAGEVGLIEPHLVHQVMDKVKLIQEMLKTTQSQQSPTLM